MSAQITSYKDKLDSGLLVEQRRRTVRENWKLSVHIISYNLAYDRNKGTSPYCGSGVGSFCRAIDKLQFHATQNELTQAWRKLLKLAMAKWGSLIYFLHHFSLPFSSSFLMRVHHGSLALLLIETLHWINSSDIKLPTILIPQVGFSEVSKLSQFLKVYHWFRFGSSVRIFPYRIISSISHISIHFWWLLEMIQRKRLYFPLLLRLY